MAKFEVDIRSIAAPDHSIENRNQLFLAKLQKTDVDEKWLLPLDGELKLKDTLGQLSDRKSITKYLPVSVSGQLGFKFSGRNYIKDHYSHDDSITFKLNENKYLLHSFIESVFVYFIASFGAYYASISSEKIALEIVRLKKSKMSLGEDDNLRCNLIWLHQINYIDDLLLKRAFGITADQAFERLNMQVELCQRVNDGVLFGDKLDSCVDNIEDAIKLDEKYRALLGSV